MVFGRDPESLNRKVESPFLLWSKLTFLAVIGSFVLTWLFLFALDFLQD